ncbi:MAG: hypothetical protein ACNA7J_14995, partial [Wenzhouxiangella sp.]
LGTFQYAAARRDEAALRALVDHTLRRHYPERAGDPHPALALLRQRHLVVLADLREQISQMPPSYNGTHQASEFDQALLEAGQSMYREQRKAATHHLRQLGIIHLDITPRALPGALVSQYRTLKASGVF